MEDRQHRKDVDQFIIDKIDSVPHLEALLLIWRSRPRAWTPEILSTRLYARPDATKRIMEDLARENLLAPVPEAPEQFRYNSASPDQDRLLEHVDAAYSEELIRLTTLIHSKASAAVREFARAFRLTKEKE